jgi:hypothetical protein
MARSAATAAKPSPILYCPFCRVARRGKSLLQHCLDKHDGQLPLVVCTNGAGEYAAAVELLRKAKLKITPLAADGR